MSKNKRIATIGVFIAVAFTLSFLESLIPINLGVPGIKIGLSNLVVLCAIYVIDRKSALLISVVRILLAGLLFSGAFSLLYSFAGGICSFVVMIIAIKTSKLSTIGVSVLGAVTHNIAQIIVAAIVVNTYQITYYFPVLLISGLISGTVIGVVTGIIVNRLENIEL